MQLEFDENEIKKMFCGTTINNNHENDVPKMIIKIVR